jgi:hypothetical protein
MQQLATLLLLLWCNILHVMSNDDWHIQVATDIAAGVTNGRSAR